MSLALVLLWLSLWCSGASSDDSDAIPVDVLPANATDVLGLDAQKSIAGYGMWLFLGCKATQKQSFGLV